MKIKPIPDMLLGDSFTLVTPEEDGFRREEIFNVRVERTSAAQDFSSASPKDATKLVAYFDCFASQPVGTVFSAGQQAEYCGEVFEIVEARLFTGDAPHHWKIIGRKIDGEHYE